MFVCIYSEDQAKLAARKYARIVQKLGFMVNTFILNSGYRNVKKSFIQFKDSKIIF
jgi:hypothetical protein